MKKIKDEYIDLSEDIKKELEKKEKEIAKEHTKAYIAIAAILSVLYRKHSIDGKISSSEMSKYNRELKLREQIATELSKAYKSEEKIIREILREITDISYKESIAIISAVAKTSLKPQLSYKDITTIINSRVAGKTWKDRMRQHKSHAIYSIDGEIINCIDKEKTIEYTDKALKAAINKDIKKPSGIIKQEPRKRSSEAILQSYKDIERQGIKARKTWISARDERVRGSNPIDQSNHIILDGTTIAINEDFESIAGGKGPAPRMLGIYDDFGCRCTLGLILE